MVHLGGIAPLGISLTIAEARRIADLLEELASTVDDELGDGYADHRGGHRCAATLRRKIEDALQGPVIRVL